MNLKYVYTVNNNKDLEWINEKMSHSDIITHVVNAHYLHSSPKQGHTCSIEVLTLLERDRTFFYKLWLALSLTFLSSPKSDLLFFFSIPC